MSRYYRILHLPTGTYLHHSGWGIKPTVWDFVMLSSAELIILQEIVVDLDYDLVMLKESMKYYVCSVVLKEHLEIIEVEADD
jgi:hypothetical protein